MRAAVPTHVDEGLVFDVEVGGESEAFFKDPFGIWGNLKTLPPVFWVVEGGPGVRPGGCWVATSADAVRTIMQDNDHFSNDRAKDEHNGTSGPPLENLFPLFMDPPDHQKYRSLLGPVFAPRSIDRSQKRLEDLSAELIDAFADKGECEFMEAYARPFPVTVFIEMMGLPVEETDQFVDWEYRIFQGENLEDRKNAAAEVAARMRDLLEVKRRQPADDIMSRLVVAEVDGKPLPPEILDGMCMLLFGAGLDTVAAGLGHTMRYLAEHPDLQARLRANPDLIPDAIEESLRYHTWVPTGRLVTKEVELCGARMMPGDWVQTILHGASNDEYETENPREFVVSREPNKHFAFGLGIHRCAGSHLARREMNIGIRMLLDRLGTFRIKPGAELRYDGGFICLGSLPLEW